VIPLWFKLCYTAFVLVIVVVWLRHYGPRNLLWLSDIALIGAVPALWMESARLASMLVVATLLLEIFWNVDLVLRLLLRRRIAGLTEYMFEKDRKRILRLWSLFHVPLPLLLLWMMLVFGYDPRGLADAALMMLVVLPASRWLGGPERNINWAYGLGRVQQRFSASAWLAMLYAGYVGLVFAPTHALMLWAASWPN